ncbi:D-isomer specific 2-hydroxyacid dehydrogenase [Apiospora arundinis]
MYIRDILAPSAPGAEAGGSGNGSGSGSANKRLDGHQLLILTDAARAPELFDPESAWRRRVAEKHPGLRVVAHDQDTWRDRAFPPGPRLGPRHDAAERRRVPGSRNRAADGVHPAPERGGRPVNQTPIFRETDVAVCTTNGVHGPQIAEWVIGTFLALNHQLPHFLDLQKEGKWKQTWPNEGMQDGVKQRVGILGYGSIGRQVARVAKALAMDVVAYTNHPRPTPASRRDTGYIVPGTGDPAGEFPSAWYSGTTDAAIDEFLGCGLDWLVIAVPLTSSTRGLISEARLQLLSDCAKKRGSAVQPFVTNIARGPVVDTDGLMKALDEGWIRGAALDVTDPEPLPEGHPLWSRRNLIVTPHVSAMSTSLGPRIADVLELNLQRFSEGEKLINQVNRKEGY